MKVVRLRSLLQIAVLAVAFSTAARASDEKAAAGVSQRDLQAKVDYCETCHGLSARGFIGFHPIPRLAGQPVEYIENELKGFVEHKRENKESPSRACLQLSRIIAAANCTPARKFLASLS